MKKYTFVFSAAYLLLTLILAAIAELVEIKSGASGLGIAAVFGASSIAAWSFHKDHARVPTLEEKKSYAWQALLSTWLVSLLLVVCAIALFFSPADTKAILGLMQTKLFLAIFAGGALFISLVNYVAIRWSFGWYANLACKAKNAT